MDNYLLTAINFHRANDFLVNLEKVPITDLVTMKMGVFREMPALTSIFVGIFREYSPVFVEMDSLTYFMSPP
ncbi:MAG: hypothetical protein ACI9ZF_000491 [Bradyrhizobium sp.]|jgi:hypothetical protein